MNQRRDMCDELLAMRNLGKTSVQWLHACGIHTAEDLRRLGAVAAYEAVKQRGFGASRVLLYAIEGALLDVAWTELPAPLKRQLNESLGQAASRNKS